MPKINFCTVPTCHSFGRYCRAHNTGELDAEDKAQAKIEKAKNSLKPNPKALTEKDKVIQRKKFFDAMIDKAPKNCMESGKPLAPSMAINPRTIVAHILAKKKVGGVPSMQFDPRNVMYFDQDVHTDFDTKGSDHVKRMKTFEKMKARVNEMWGEIPADERRNVPDHFKPE